MTKLIYELTGEAPNWAKEAEFYYQNAYGEQWIAKINDDSVMIAASNIKWKEIKIMPTELEITYKIASGRLEKGDIDTPFENPISEWVMNVGERLWVASVLWVAAARIGHLISK